MFVIGYIFIALEHQTGINKTAIALLLGILLWVMYIFSGPQIIVGADPAAFQNFIHQHPAYEHLSPLAQVREYILNWEIIDHLGNISEILFYLIGALTIVETIDVHQGFDGITRSVKTKNKKKLLWLVAFITFFMSSVLDNMTSAIVMMMLIQKLLSEQRERWIFGSIIVIAANSGGAWSPIGDVTTIMLWVRGNISTSATIPHLFLPSLVSALVPVLLISRYLHGKVTPPNAFEENRDNQLLKVLKANEKLAILCIGVFCLLFVPIFKTITHLPPFMGILWVFTELMYRRTPINEDLKLRLSKVVSRIDGATLMFFLGILLAVDALRCSGVLGSFSLWLDDTIGNVYAVNLIIGTLSAVVDNVPLVAAAIGMYPLIHTSGTLSPYLMNFTTDGTFWELLAYCAGIGGSILIIGSAAGVVVMGMERINFMWYMKHITWIALLGYLAGIGVYYLQSLL